MSTDRLTAQNIPVRYSSEDAAVLLTVQTLLDFVSHRDFNQIQSVIYWPGSTARLRPSGMVWGTIEEVLKSIADLPAAMEEYMCDAEVRIAGDMASVWAPCRITVDGKIVSEATNSIALHKEGGNWKISSISDTATTKLSS
jgi:hypothetical protein